MTHHFNTLNLFISPVTNVLMTEAEASTILEGKHMQGWRNMVRSASIYLEEHTMDITQQTMLR